MSIINDALKKAGQPIVTEAKAPAKKRAAYWGPMFVMGILVVIGAPILMPLLRNPYRNDGPARQTPVGPDLSKPHMKKQFGMEEAALPRVASGMAPRFTMSGLIYSTGTSYALINGKVLTVGDVVGGAKLVNVSPEGAVLEYRGQQILLPANI